MTTRNNSSLLDFLDAPVVVGDPDGRAVYANPAFKEAFSLSDEAMRVQPLAGLFEGGGREAVLGAVARVCQGSSTVRFRLRHGESGFVALASPIEAQQGRVGVLILLTPEMQISDIGPALQRELGEAIEEITRCLGELGDAVGGRREPGHVKILEDAAEALERVRKRCERWSAGLPPE